MGRPTDAHIFSKLTRKYLKFDLRRSSFNSGYKYYHDLQNSWVKTGMDSPESKLIQQKIDVLDAKDDQEYRDLKIMVKRLPVQLNQILGKTKPKYQYKGRYQTNSKISRMPSQQMVKWREEMEGFKF